MEERRFGRTDHQSTVAIFGAAALSQVSQEVADVAMQQVIDAGVNHIDVAPSYGEAELRIGPWMPRYRRRFFLGCKTMERAKADAAAELRRSLERLQVESFDLYQAHAVRTMEELDQVTGSGGALEAMLDARDEGLVRYLGITGHGFQSPAVFIEALRRFDFDTMLFPVNFVQYAIPEYQANAQTLLEICGEKDVGVMAIKAICRGPWGDKQPTHTTWYQPFEEPAMIRRSVDFALSQPVTGLCTAGDVTVLPTFLEACENFESMTADAQADLISTASAYEPLFAPA
jgi:aryl-alcohol dehydrogenase-like predicted oxidoreductase